MSRAFGDKTLAPYVIADPFISVRPIDPNLDLFLYLVSDGVTDMVEDPMGCQVVMEQLSLGHSTAEVRMGKTAGEEAWRV